MAERDPPGGVPAEPAAAGLRDDRPGDRAPVGGPGGHRDRAAGPPEEGHAGRQEAEGHPERQAAARAHDVRHVPGDDFACFL